MVSVAVVTGASSGLGAGLVAAFEADGVAVGACARRVPPAGAARSSVDVTDAAAVEAFCRTVAHDLGPIDLWVNNAGILGPIDLVPDADPDEFAENVRVNVTGTFNGCRAYLRHRRDAGGGGVLVNISSGAATSPIAGWAAYSASKAAADMLTQVILAEGSVPGLRAYAIAPGLVDTAMQEQIRATDPRRMPDVDRFLRAKEEDAFNEPRWVAQNLLAVARGEQQVDWRWRVPPEPGT